MQVQCFNDGGLVILPETPQDQSFLEHTAKVPKEAGAMVVCKRVTVSPHDDRIAHIVLGPPELLQNVPSYAQMPAPPSDAETVQPAPVRKRRKA